MSRGWRVMVLIGLCAGLGFGGVGDWRTYTAKRNIRQLAWDAGRQTVWAVTGGGMFSYRDADQTFVEFTASEGLQTTDVSAVAVDREGTIWVGATDGFLHRYHPSTRSWEYVSDIFDKHEPQQGINRLKVLGDTLMILSDIGVSVFSIPRMEFGDTYKAFGTGSGALVGGATDLAIANGTIWVSTRAGVASTPLANPNPSAPDSWQVYTTAQGLPMNTVRRLEIAFDTIFAATPGGLALLRGSTWATVDGTAGLNVVDLSSNRQPCADCQNLYLVADAGLLVYDGTAPARAVAGGFRSDPTAMAGNLLVGTGSGVLFFDQTFTARLITAPGPPSDKFVSLAVDKRGVVWSGTGVNNGSGFMSFDGVRWRAYTVQGDPRLGSNNYWKISIGPNDAKWASSWGAGIALLDDGGNVKNVFNSTNGIPPSVDPSYVVAGGAATDQSGVTWITDRTPPGDTAVVKFNPDSSLGYVRGLSMRSPNVIVFTDVVIDLYGTKWFANYSRFEPFVAGRAPGLYYYNENFSIPGTTNGWGRLQPSDGLTSDKAYALAVDNDGNLWIGTDQGISIIFDPSDPKNHIASYHPISDQLVQGIVVDPLNNKWVATRTGVFVFTPDGTSILAHYTVAGTGGKLLDDDVASISMNAATGTMYFGTEKGLSSLGTPALAPKAEFDKLSFSPNPYYLPASRSLVVDGLVQGSLLKILSIDGRLMREITTPGGRVGFWDGTDATSEAGSKLPPAKWRS
ncbi:MAG: hypothetical protein E6K56_03545 [Ignavibacteria bacterium]|nr:MAG: hypothetical protein E6K56_03545 [Ignavibacteria bacterium]